MSAHPNDVARRSRIASIALALIACWLGGSFFKAQVIEHDRYKLQSQENRLRSIPLPAPRGIIYDRNRKIIAENLPGYSVSILAPSVDSLRAALRQLSTTVSLSKEQMDAAERRYRRDRNRPTVIIADASLDVISVLEEHRLNFPGLIIQSVPKRFYPEGSAVASFIGYTGEITESDLNTSEYDGYKPGQLIGKGGIEKQYEKLLRGKEGVRYEEVDARGRTLQHATPRPDLNPEPAPPLNTNIDLDLQRFMASIFGDSLQGGAVAIDPVTGGVLALYSAPSFDPNRFTGGIPIDYWRTLLSDPRLPLVNKAVQGTYPPGSTYKLATAVLGMEAGIANMHTHMAVPCHGGYQYGSRYFRCWERRGHGDVDLAGAIKVSCDTYFYQLGLKIGLSKLIAGGISLDMRAKSGIDIPEEKRARFPANIDYYNKTYGRRGWSSAEILNLSIGQGANSQTVVNMAKFYTALATDGSSRTPQIVQGSPVMHKIMHLSPDQLQEIRMALAGVVSAGGTAAGSRIEGVTLAGKTGTAQNHTTQGDHAWFVGFAPADDPKIVVSVMLEFGLHGSRAARIASSIISHYLKVIPVSAVQTEG
jgi:penicillin-binding protein 2